jgi:hypothetical protein
MVSDGLILQFSARVPEHPVNRVPAFVCNSAVRGVKPKHKPALTRITITNTPTVRASAAGIATQFLYNSVMACADIVG